MWFVVKTEVFTERRSIDTLREKFKDTIADIYFPLRKRVYKDDQGEEKARFVPVLRGLFFIRVQDERRLSWILSPYGYFMYKGVDYTGGAETERFFLTQAHLLCADRKSLTLGEIIRQARIPDEEMDRFIYYTDKLGEGIEGLSIVDQRYGDLVRVNDTIRILSGPLTGWVGVIRQIKHKGRKDRHLLVRFGNNHCLNISNIRQYDMRIEHEATKGAKSEEVGVWRAIDQMTGYLQAKNPAGNAADTLRNIFKDYQKKTAVYRNRRMSDIAYSDKTAEMKVARRKEVLGHIDESMRNNFLILANYFKADGETVDRGLKELIPDVVLRPFLTPTSGVSIPQGQEYAVLCHNEITELILRRNLRAFFRGEEYDSGKYAPVFEEDYEYYAHFALLKTEEGKLKIICSWGGFYDYYASQNKEERTKFIDDLEAKKYPRLHYLLTESPYKFESTNGIGGFSLETDMNYTTDPEELGREASEYLTHNPSLLTQLTAAAVEVWQGARLLVWRKLLQRYVLLHKVPVTDQPSVITHDTKLEEAFVKADGKLDMTKVAETLTASKGVIEEHLENKEVAEAVFKFLSTSLVYATHFAQDELYNYVCDTFNPDRTLSGLFNRIVEQCGEASNSRSIVRHLHKGMAELQELDSWRYFKFPSFLKQTRKTDKVISSFRPSTTPGRLAKRRSVKVSTPEKVS